MLIRDCESRADYLPPPTVVVVLVAAPPPRVVAPTPVVEVVPVPLIVADSRLVDVVVVVVSVLPQEVRRSPQSATAGVKRVMFFMLFVVGLD